MIVFSCDTCKKPIDPMTDRHFNLPNLRIAWNQKIGEVHNLHFCTKDCFIKWLNKNAEPSSIISALNPHGPAL